MLKKFPLDKINDTKNAFSSFASGTKNTLSFLLRAPIHHSFTFNFGLLYELKRNVRLSKTMCRIFHFRFGFIFIKVYIFVLQNAWTLTLNISHLTLKLS